MSIEIKYFLKLLRPICQILTRGLPLLVVAVVFVVADAVIEVGDVGWEGKF